MKIFVLISMWLKTIDRTQVFSRIKVIFQIVLALASIASSFSWRNKIGVVFIGFSQNNVLFG